MEDGSYDIEKERIRIDCLDRISALPEAILQHIMSFLPVDQLVRTSVLSKAWLRAWITFPVLEIDEITPPNPKQREKMLKARSYWEKVVRIRHKYMVAISKLTLKTSRREADAAFKLTIRCILYVIKNNVKELELEHSLPVGVWYDLPQIVLCSKSVNVLKLKGYKLGSLRSDVELSSLRKLSLSDVYAADQVVNNLVAQCPLIEDLEFVRCQGFNSLEIKALNARSISIASLAASCKIDITSCQNLKCLILSEGPFTDGWLCCQVSRLLLLEQLCIWCCDNIGSIKILGPCLKILTIFRCKKLVEVMLDTPNLNIFRYTGDIVSFSSGALTLSEADLHFSSNKIDSEWYEKYIELIARFHKFSKVLNLQSFDCQNVHTPRELRLILPQPLSGVKHLNFRVHLSNRNFLVAKVVDFLLWISPHTETACLDYPENKRFDFKFSYKQQPVYEGETAQCCKSLPVSCWEHCIKKVDIDVKSTYLKMNMTTYEVQISSKVERFVFEGENILGKIDDLSDPGFSNFEMIY